MACEQTTVLFQPQQSDPPLFTFIHTYPTHFTPNPPARGLELSDMFVFVLNFPHSTVKEDNISTDYAMIFLPSHLLP